ncbi:hypothetical protein QF042_003564 [Pedobacter sp. W3I1]|uniref:hypothetical protein n=1 Tax=Pedobacter sp. W3I1 TaxID=3042291 RepID=UPI0027812660|nr:hypothetical protein [Pedobacter sp. W3I1]MDQ0639999.1 hypothetical protein [Pedobacter sp. W3I1]
MAKTESTDSEYENGKNADAQEKLSQIALGNTQAAKSILNEAEPIPSTPKTSGTGANPAAATPNSLIVHEDVSGDERYEEGSSETPEKDK